MNKNKKPTMEKRNNKYRGSKSSIEAVNSNQMCVFIKGLNKSQRLKLILLSIFNYILTNAKISKY